MSSSAHEEHTSLLATNSDGNAINDGSSSEESRRKTLEAIRVYQREIARLNRDLNRFATAVNLPPEILAEIFMVLRETLHNEHCVDHPIPLQYLVVGQVCSRWRDVALNYPLLWSRVGTDMPSDLLAEMLNRSKQVPLTATVGVPADIAPTRIIPKETHRICDLRIIIPQKVPLSSFADLVGSAPLLRSLNWSFQSGGFKLMDDETQPRDLNLELHSPPPKLEFLSLALPVNIRNLSTNIFPLPTITTLNIRNRPPSPVLPILRKMPQLKHLHLMIDYSLRTKRDNLSPHTESSTTPVDLFYLRTLELEGSSTSIAWYSSRFNYPLESISAQYHCYPAQGAVVSDTELEPVFQAVLTQLRRTFPSNPKILARVSLDLATMVPEGSISFDVLPVGSESSYSVTFEETAESEPPAFFHRSLPIIAESLHISALWSPRSDPYVAWTMCQEGLLEEIEFDNTSCDYVTEYLIPSEAEIRRLQRDIPSPITRFSALEHILFQDVIFGNSRKVPSHQWSQYYEGHFTTTVEESPLFYTLLTLVSKHAVPLRVISFTKCHRLSQEIITEFRRRMEKYGVQIDWDGN